MNISLSQSILSHKIWNIFREYISRQTLFSLHWRQSSPVGLPMCSPGSRLDLPEMVWHTNTAAGKRRTFRPFHGATQFLSNWNQVRVSFFWKHSEPVASSQVSNCTDDFPARSPTPTPMAWGKDNPFIWWPQNHPTLKSSFSVSFWFLVRLFHFGLFSLTCWGEACEARVEGAVCTRVESIEVCIPTRSTANFAAKHCCHEGVYKLLVTKMHQIKHQLTYFAPYVQMPKQVPGLRLCCWLTVGRGRLTGYTGFIFSQVLIWIK